MKAIYLIKNGKSETAFETREITIENATGENVLIETECFGLNFADVMARLGYYKACPPLPAVIGYDVVGRIKEFGEKVKGLKVGMRVTALTRFGGYASHVLTNYHGVVEISEDADAAEATALATQYSTAYYALEVGMKIYDGEHILIQAAAGGVGTALIQLAKRHNCIIFGTAGSPEKLEYLKQQGVHHPINYNETDFEEYIKKIRGDKGVDAVFDSIGGNYVKKALNILAPGGRLAIYGAAKIAGSSSKKSMFRAIKTIIGFGKYRPTKFFGESQSLIGINMLKIGDFKPEILQDCMKNVVKLYQAGEIKPTIGKIFNANQIIEAHNYLQKRKSIGKVVIKW